MNILLATATRIAGRAFAEGAESDVFNVAAFSQLFSINFIGAIKE